MTMRVTRRAFGELPERIYDTLIGDAFFVSRGFAGLWTARGGEPCTWCVEADGTVLAVLPGVEFHRGPIRRFVSMPDGCYGGVFVAPYAVSERARCAQALLEALTGRYTIIDVFDFGRSIGAAPGYAMKPCEARLVPLTGSDWMPEDAELVRQAYKAQREGIRIERFDARRHLDGLMHLARLTAQVHRCRQRYPRAFFVALARLAATDDRVIWRYCERDGTPVCSHIYVIERGLIQAWQSYFDRAYSFMKPNQAMRLDVCRTFAARGGRMLNLGSTPVHAVGLASYKRRWGGRLVTYPDYAWNALAGVGARVKSLFEGPPAPSHAPTVAPMQRVRVARPV